ncbi:hypothetical protein B0H16DRAFT_1005115 [Mycena metata]|uniref:Uncharacterized protein n=1 Tax=Mycena metata TaxID=1033252 RepID=A0AAD7NUB7_9AGAR|nr:hypothetical protein B0H16DRAFT_1005115 [Mycena metata]
MTHSLRISPALPGPYGSSQRRSRPNALYLCTWTSLLLSLLILVTSIVDLGLWMNMSAAAATLVYHIAVLILSSRTPEVPSYHIFTSVPTAGCASILVFAWIAGLAMTVLALVIGRDEFPGPPPLIRMAFPVHVALAALTGVELLLMVVIARLSGPISSTRAQSALQRRLLLRPASAARRLLSV